MSSLSLLWMMPLHTNSCSFIVVVVVVVVVEVKLF